MADASRTTILIAAMGGEGGGVLSQWLTEALERAGWHVQYTAIPGVAQRTGATTYYIECVREAELQGREPVLSLLPVPGKIDVAVVTELAEVARMVERGFVTPERTLLVGSTHRVYATSEKMAMADGRMDDRPALAAARSRSRQAVLVDFAALAAKAGAVINAPVFGAFARVNPLGLDRAALEAVLGEGAANRRGFEAGWTAAGTVEAEAEAPPEVAGVAAETLAGLPPNLSSRVSRYPEPCRDIVARGVERLIDYQDAAYAELFLDRLDSLGAQDEVLLTETARQLANWMSFHDIVRVAELKRSPQRIAQIAAARKGEGSVLSIADFFSPGPEELAAILPPTFARPLLAWATKNNRRERWSFPLDVSTSSVHGQMLLAAVASLKGRRRSSDRFLHEQANIERWLEALRSLAAKNLAAARVFADCARLLKGYGDTWERGNRNFGKILAVLPQVMRSSAPESVLSALKAAALADPDGKRLAEALRTFELEGGSPP